MCCFGLVEGQEEATGATLGLDASRDDMNHLPRVSCGMFGAGTSLILKLICVVLDLISSQVAPANQHQPTLRSELRFAPWT